MFFSVEMIAADKLHVNAQTTVLHVQSLIYLIELHVQSYSLSSIVNYNNS